MGIPKRKTLTDMQTTIVASNSFVANNSTYFNIELLSGTQAVNVLVVKGEFNYLNVQVKNAMHKVWKGGGKQFANKLEALGNYVKPEIKAAIEAAAELAQI